MEQDNFTDFTETIAVRSLAAIAQQQRLRVFRALVVAGQSGLTPGAMVELLSVSPSSLSFHLKELTHSGMASSEARGRNLIYRANFAQMNALLAYLTEHCCQGDSCEATADVEAAACAVC